MSHSDMLFMKTFIFLFIGFIFSVTTQAGSFGEIVEVKKNIPLSNDEDIYKDFYIKINSTTGLKKNLVVKVFRKVEIKDTSSKIVGDFKTPIGQLKLIQIDSKVAVAREFKLFPRTEEAVIEQVGIMIGDEVDLVDSFIDTSKPKSQRTPAEALGEKTAQFVSPMPTESVENSGQKAPETTPIKIKTESLSRDI